MSLLGFLIGGACPTCKQLHFPGPLGNLWEQTPSGAPHSQLFHFYVVLFGNLWRGLASLLTSSPQGNVNKPGLLRFSYGSSQLLCLKIVILVQPRGNSCITSTEESQQWKKCAKIEFRLIFKKICQCCMFRKVSMFCNQ